MLIPYDRPANPNRGHFARCALASAVLLSGGASAAHAAQTAPHHQPAVSLAGDVFAAAVFIGIMLFFVSAAFVFLKAREGARRAEQRAVEETAALARQLDLAQSIMTAEPQALMVGEKDEAPRLVTHSLALSSGVPAKIRMLLRFATWAERDAALDLEGEAEEAARAGRAVQRDPEDARRRHRGGRGARVGQLLFPEVPRSGRAAHRARQPDRAAPQPERGARIEKALFDALSIPVWFRGSDGQADNGSTAPTSPPSRRRALDDVIDHQSELLELHQRRAGGNGRSARARRSASGCKPSSPGERHAFDDHRRAHRPGERGRRHRRGAAGDRAGQPVAPDGRARPHARSRGHGRRHFRPRSSGWGSTIRRIRNSGGSIRAVARGQAAAGRNFRQAAPDAPAARAGRLPQWWALSQGAESASEIKANETAASEGWWHLPDGRTRACADRSPPRRRRHLLYDDVTEILALESRYNALIKVQRETLDNLREGVAVFGSDGRLQAVQPRLREHLAARRGRFLEARPHIDEVIAAVQAADRRRG